MKLNYNDGRYMPNYFNEPSLVNYAVKTEATNMTAQEIGTDGPENNGLHRKQPSKRF